MTQLVIPQNANNIYEYLYDTITFTGGAAVTANTPYSMFSTICDGGVSKYFWQTNNFSQSKCQYDAMIILAIGFEVFMNTIGGTFPSLSDVNKITKNLSLTIYKNNTPILQVPISRIGGGNQITGNVANTNNSTVGVFTSGIAAMDSMYKVGYHAQGDVVSEGIPFVKDEKLQVAIVAENGFTPSVTCYAKLKFFCDTWTKIA
jgi:hypothetical protein